MAVPPLYLLRHGETEWNRARRIQGQLNSVLTPEGEGHARRQGEILAGLRLEAGLRCFASPLLRTRQTAELALGPLGLEPQFDPRLMEVSMGSWQGQLYDDVIAAEGARLAGLSGFQVCLASDGETEADLRARLGAFLAERDGPSLIVSHGIALSVLRGLALGLDLAGMEATGRSQGVVIELRDGQERIHR